MENTVGTLPSHRLSGSLEEATLVEQDRTREDEWFLKNERDLIETARLARHKREQERAALEKAEDLRRKKEAHFMKCPKCGHDLVEKEFDTVILDVCSHCEGVYCDPGELEKLYLRRQTERAGLIGRLLGLK